MAKLTLADIADTRAYERERDEFRRRVIELKKKRRVHVGPFVTFVFENADSIRFQIQEMARVEHLSTDAAIQAELDVYNPLIPYPGTLAATMLIELTDEAGLREWLPKLVGIETMIELRMADGTVVSCRVDAAHAAQLTREDVTSSVHYVYFDLSPVEVESFAAGGVALAITHPAYQHSTELGADTVAELTHTLRNGG